MEKYDNLVASILGDNEVSHVMLEYAECTSESKVCIETDYYSDSSTDKISVVFSTTDIEQSGRVYGTAYIPDETSYEALIIQDNILRGVVTGKAAPNNAVLVTALDSIKYSIVRNLNTYYINGAPSRNILNAIGISKSDAPMCLFSRAVGSTTTFYGRIYKAMFEPIDGIGRFLVPVRIIETNIVCFYCLWTNKYFYPKSGTLIAGPDKRDYDYYGNIADAVIPTSQDSFIGTFNLYSQTRSKVELGVSNVPMNYDSEKSVFRYINTSGQSSGISVLNNQFVITNGSTSEIRPMNTTTNIVGLNNAEGQANVNGETFDVAYTSIGMNAYIKPRIGITTNARYNNTIVGSGITNTDITSFKEWDSSGNLITDAFPIRISKNTLTDVGGRTYSTREYALWNSVIKEALPLYSTFEGKGGGDVGEFILNDYGVEVNHLMANGVEYIKTGITTSPSTVVEVTFKSPLIGAKFNVSIFGSRTNYDKQDGVSLFNFDVTSRLRYDSGLSLTDSKYVVFADTWITTKQSNTYNYKDGLLDTPPTGLTTTGSGYELYLFSVNSANVATTLYNTGLCISSFKVWEGETIVADYIPIKLTKQAYGTYALNSFLMLDNITNTIPTHIGNFSGE